MEVEIVGGPDDGKIMAVPDGTNHLKFAIPPSLKSMLRIDDDPWDSAPKVISRDIHKDPFGRFYVTWWQS